MDYFRQFIARHLQERQGPPGGVPSNIASAISAHLAGTTTTTSSDTTSSGSSTTATTSTTSDSSSTTATTHTSSATAASTAETTSHSTSAQSTSSPSASSSSSSNTNSAAASDSSTLSTSTIVGGGIVASDHVTQTASSIPSTATAGESSNTPLAVAGHAHKNGGMSGGAIAAAVVVPILAVLLLLLGALLFLRRKRRNNRDSASAAFLPPTGEKAFGHTAGPPVVPAPALTSRSNNAYFSGLDTSSHDTPSQRNESGEYYAPSQRGEAGGAAYNEPPPPYLAGAAKARKSEEAGAQARDRSSSLPTLNEPSDELSNYATAHNSPEISPVDMTSADAAAGRAFTPLDRHLMVSPISPRPSTSQTHSSAKSITSTLYSDNASVHDARQERISVGGAHLIRGAASGSGENPFHDPESPVGSLADDERSHLTPDRHAR